MEGESMSDNLEQTRQWSIILHFSQFSGLLIPFGGFLVPIIIWQLKKNELPGIDAHGKMITNWILSAFIYGLVNFFLIFLIIGIVLLPILGGCCLVFPIIGGIQASNGKLWKYPLSIPFFR